jgi:DNA transformation protein
MAVRRDYRDYVLEQLAALGGFSSRPMFGGVGLYCDEHFFGLIADDTLYLRVDDHNRADYTARGMRAFRPYADRPHLSITYYEIPVEVLEDAAQLASWARRSVAAAQAKAAHKNAAGTRRRRRPR